MISGYQRSRRDVLYARSSRASFGPYSTRRQLTHELIPVSYRLCSGRHRRRAASHQSTVVSTVSTTTRTSTALRGGIGGGGPAPRGDGLSPDSRVPLGPRQRCLRALELLELVIILHPYACFFANFPATTGASEDRSRSTARTRRTPWRNSWGAVQRSAVIDSHRRPSTW